MLRQNFYYIGISDLDVQTKTGSERSEKFDPDPQPWSRQTFHFETLLLGHRVDFNKSFYIIS